MWRWKPGDLRMDLSFAGCLAGYLRHLQVRPCMVIIYEGGTEASIPKKQQTIGRQRADTEGRSGVCAIDRSDRRAALP